MQFFGRLAGKIIICFGIMITVVGCVIGNVMRSGTGTTLPGITLIIAGAAIYWLASTKVCNQCKQRIKQADGSCKHCGAKQD
jgi:hypothetical protein